MNALMAPDGNDDDEEVPTPIIVYGGSGQSFSIAQSLMDEAPPGEEFVVRAFLDDFAPDGETSYAGIPVRRPEAVPDLIRTLPCLVAIGRPSARRQVADKVRALGGRFARLYRARRAVHRHVTIGDGSMISTRSYIGPSTVIGEHVMLLGMCSIGHDVVIEDYVMVCPSVTVSGYVKVEEEVFLGAGAIIVEGRPDRPLVIGRGAYVAAGAVVTKSVPAGAKVVGNPARPMREFVRSLRS